MRNHQAQILSERWLDCLPADFVARSTLYTQTGYLTLVAGTAVAVAAAFVIYRSRLILRAGAALERSRPRPILTTFVQGALFFTALEFLLLPWKLIAGWNRNQAFGLSDQAVGDWVFQQLAATAVNAIAIGLFIVLAFALIRRSGAFWWLSASALAGFAFLFAIIAAPVFIEPLFNKYTPLPPGDVREEVEALARQVGVPGDRIFVYDGSRQSGQYTAYVSGHGESARISLSDMMIKDGADIAQVRAVVPHELGHHVAGHVFWIWLFMTLAAILVLWSTDKLMPLGMNLFGAREVPDTPGPADLPVLYAIVSVVLLGLTPAFNTFSRTLEYFADAYSLEIAQEPDGLARALLATAEYRAPRPSALEEFLFYSHPSIQKRIEGAMVWKVDANSTATALEYPPPVCPALN